MSTEKQQLINEIETLPDELTSQAIKLIEYLKSSYSKEKTPENVMIKNIAFYRVDEERKLVNIERILYSKTDWKVSVKF